MEEKMKRILMILCCALVLTGCSKKQEITPEVIELEELKGFQPDAENPDSDNDGITDEDEEKLGTNPNKADTDGDGIYDGLEIRLGLDPLNAKSDGKNKDSERTFEEEYSCDTATLTVEGNYATADIVFQQSVGVFNVPIAITPVYEIYMENQKFESATIKFDYNPYYGQHVGVYQYLDDGSYELVGEGTEVALEHFSRYFLGELVNLDALSRPTLDIALVIDNSGSMYSAEQCEGSDENDVDFKRIDMAKALIEQSDVTTRFSFYTFTHDVTKVMDMTSNHKALCEAIDSIKDELPHFNGTAANNAVFDAISDFDYDKNRRHYVILLSDGYDTEGLFDFNWSTDTVVSNAASKNVVIICIGLGNDIDVEHLTELATRTGGFYRYARSADDLADLYEQINTVLNNNYVDLDGDGELDSILLADSGFDIATDVFPFNNFRVTDADGVFRSGQCFGIASLTQLYYVGRLPYSRDAVSKHKYGSMPWSQSLSAQAYNFDDSNFFKEKGDYVDNSEALNNYRDYQELFDILAKPAAEKWDVVDGKAVFKDDIREVLEQFSLVEFFTLDEKGTLDGKKFTKVEFFRFKLGNADTASDEDESMYDTLLAINNYFSSQTADGNKRFYFSSTSSIESNSQAMVSLIEYLSAGVPLIVYGESHAINAVSLYRDLENPNEYKLFCYDNNDHEELKVLTIKRIKTSFLKDGATAWTSDYVYRIYDTDGVFTTAGKEINVNFDLAYGLDM